MGPIHRLAILPLALACSLITADAVAAIYKWVDGQGVTHFSETPPGEGAGEVQARPLPKGASDRFLSTPPPSVPEPAGLTGKAKEAADAAQAQRRNRCAVARRNRSVLEQQRRVYQTNDKGERVFIADQERQAEIARADAEIKRHCDTDRAAVEQQKQDAAGLLREEVNSRLCREAQARVRTLSQPGKRASSDELERARREMQTACKAAGK